MEAQKILVKDVQVDPTQPRKIYANMEGLTQSIKDNGFDPYRAILVRTCPDPEGRKFQTVWGNRRTMAAEKAGVEHLYAFVVDGMSEQEIYEKQLMENEHREDLRTMERAFAIKDGLERGISIGRLAKILAVSGQTLKADLELCGLAPELHKFVDNGKISKEVARKLATSFESVNQQMTVWNNVLPGKKTADAMLAAIQAYIDKQNQRDIFSQAKREAGENGGLMKARKASERLEKIVAEFDKNWTGDPNVINARKRDIGKLKLMAKAMRRIGDKTLEMIQDFEAKQEINAPKIAVNE